MWNLLVDYRVRELLTIKIKCSMSTVKRQRHLFPEDEATISRQQDLQLGKVESNVISRLRPSLALPCSAVGPKLKTPAISYSFSGLVVSG